VFPFANKKGAETITVLSSDGSGKPTPE